MNPKPPKLRLVTYNIHKGIGGVDRKYRPERIVETLAHYDADMVFLQEVDEGVPRSRRDRQVDLLGEALDYPHRSYFPNVRLRRGHYGNAILSRLPFDYEDNLDLTIPLKKRRAALHVRTTLGESSPLRRRLWLFNVHLGLAEFERRRQLGRVLAYLGRHRAHGDTAIVVGGDFNDVWGGLGRRVLAPAGFASVPRPAPTFPAVRPLRALDRVFVRGPVQIDRCFRGRMLLATQASDHLPLITTLRVR